MVHPLSIINQINISLKQLQNESTILYKNSLHCLTSVYKTEGIRGLYKGLSASLLGLTESTLQFATYEALKKQARKGKGNDQDGKFKIFNSCPFFSLEWLDLFICAATAKLGAAILTYPHEVLRTRLRQSPSTNGEIKYKSLMQTARLIYRQEGISAFYGGMTAHLMRVVPNAAILFFSYEVLVGLWTGYFKKEEDKFIKRKIN